MALNIEGKTFTWPVVLRDNPLTEDTTDRIITLKKSDKTQTYKDAAKEIARERTEYRPETIENICTLYEQKKAEMLLNGQSFKSDYFLYQPSVQGSFSANGELLPNSELRYAVNVTATDALRKILDAQIKYNIVERQEQGGAYISRVLNQFTGEENAASANDLVKVYGNKIKSVDASGADKKGKVALVNESGEETVITKIGENTPSYITFTIPQDLPAGTYRLVVETYFSASNSLLKTMRRIEYSEPITIS